MTFAVTADICAPNALAGEKARERARGVATDNLGAEIEHPIEDIPGHPVPVAFLVETDPAPRHGTVEKGIEKGPPGKAGKVRAPAGEILSIDFDLAVRVKVEKEEADPRARINLWER